MSLTRAVTRGLVIAAVTVSAFGTTNAFGRTADVIADPPKPRVKATPVADTEATKPAPKGMAVRPTSTGRTQAHMSLPSTTVVSNPCSGSARTNTRLAMMKNSAAYSHCDFP